ncbi:hypothetical protein ONE63_003126 [Megalurothrips usitatus]|uniref:TATA box binding protein associated factor (TAF) histone-like fold domain-containing protein n=1 Tax=Megalurothrips usitatus TaxID=439358 RepID=A0AAV7X6D7_9NEOP|nr:hypothetical protein ONE63_003126 [Megalurothrips usitatus]
MERFVAPQPKRKVRREATAAAAAQDAAVKRPGPLAEADEANNGPSSNNNRSFVCVGPDAVAAIAESIGLAHLADDVAASLAEDVSYRLQEIINASCTLMHKSKRRKLLASDVNSAFQVSNVNHIFGHSQNQPFNFLRLAEGLYVPDDHEVELSTIVRDNFVPRIKKPSYVTTSYPLLQSVKTTPVNGHIIKTEVKPVTLHSFKPGMVNGDIDSRSKVNGCVRFANHSGIREKLKRDSEEEFHLSKAQLAYFKIVARNIVEGHPKVFQEVLSSLRHNKKAETVCAPLLNFVALSVCHIPRHYGLLTRLLETLDAMLFNVNTSPNHSIAVNRIVNALLAITADQNVIRGKYDFVLRRKAAQSLTRVLLIWGIEEQHAAELLSRVARVLGDSKEKIQSYYGALVIFQSLGKSAIGWLFPLLKSFLPLLEKRFPMALASSNTQLEEMRSVLLDIVELLYCDTNTYRFKLKATTIQEDQAMIQLDSLLYHYCGDAVCARRRPSNFEFEATRRRRINRAHAESRLGQKVYRRLDLRYLSYCPQKQLQKQKQKLNHCDANTFGEVFVAPVIRRKDILFKFAGANPVPKDGLRKKVLDRTHVQFMPVSSNQLQTSFPQQYLMVGRLHHVRCKRSKQWNYTGDLLNVL